MAKNSMSEVGYAEDLIRSYIQFGCAEIHAKTLYEKALANLENGRIENLEDSEVLQAHLDKCEEYRQDILEYSSLRRSVMRKLFEMFDGDKDMWCQAKHLGIGAMTLFEAYEGSDDDLELLHLSIEANKAFVKAMTRFLGAELSDCAACLADFLKGETA